MDSGECEQKNNNICKIVHVSGSIKRCPTWVLVNVRYKHSTVVDSQQRKTNAVGNFADPSLTRLVNLNMTNHNFTLTSPLRMFNSDLERESHDESFHMNNKNLMNTPVGHLLIEPVMHTVLPCYVLCRMRSASALWHSFHTHI